MPKKLDIVIKKLGEQNTIVSLTELTKQEILDQLAAVIANPDRNILAFKPDASNVRSLHPSDYVTLSEYLESLGLQVTVEERQRINYYAAKLYRETYGKPSRIIYRSNGITKKKSIKLSGYAPDELWVIDQAIELAGLRNMAG